MPISYIPIKVKGRAPEEVGKTCERPRMNKCIDKIVDECLEFCIDHKEESSR